VGLVPKQRPWVTRAASIGYWIFGTDTASACPAPKNRQKAPVFSDPDAGIGNPDARIDNPDVGILLTDIGIFFTGVGIFFAKKEYQVPPGVSKVKSRAEKSARGYQVPKARTWYLFARFLEIP
jgi:hypothetical protein